MRDRTTLDGFLQGALELEQPLPGEGYRANVDALHLARFAANVKPRARRVVDLGAGVGAVALAYAHLAQAAALVLVEREPVACELARRNVERAGRGSAARVLERDVGNLDVEDTGGEADLVLANPPYTLPRGGRPSKHAPIEAAKRGELAPFLTAMTRVLAPLDGVTCVCYPTHALVDLVCAAAAVGLHPASVQLVRADAMRPARIALVTLIRSSEMPVDVPVLRPVQDRAPHG